MDWLREQGADADTIDKVSVAPVIRRRRRGHGLV